MYSQAGAILWAQWRTTLNYLGAQRSGMIFPTIVLVLWYGLWLFGAWALELFASTASEYETLRTAGPAALLMILLYWQVIPLLMVSTGSSLDLKKLLPYPVPHSQLFFIEVMLRVTTGVEMIVLLCGLGIGLMRNPAVPLGAPLFLAPFIVLNMLLSAAFRDLLSRLLARKRIREVLVLALVLTAALPQVLLMSQAPLPIQRAMKAVPLDFWPWTATCRLALGDFSLISLAALACWVGLAWLFGRQQFERGLRFDHDAARATQVAAPSGRNWAEVFFQLPNRFLPDPLAAVVEKELRFLSRTPRFRLVFTMGFSFGLLIWLPMLRGNAHGSFMSSNYLAFVSLYSLMLMGEVSFWNAFGFDRSAVQAYYVAPIPFTTVLIGKNITTAIFVFLEISMICLVCVLFRFSVPFTKILEAYSVAAVMALFLMAMGNIGSVRGPKPVNPSQAWRSAASRVQAMLLVVYPVAVLPIGMAFAARYAFSTDLAFYGVLGVDLAIGALVYWLALESASQYAYLHRETLIATLSRTEGPVA